MQKRRVTITIGGVPCVFYSDDSAEYLAALAQRANTAMRETAGFSDRSAYRNAVLSVLSVTDELLRTEQRARDLQRSAEQRIRELQESERKASDDRGDGSSVLADRKNRPPVCEPRNAVSRRSPAKEEQKEQDRAQITVWDILGKP